MAQRWKRIEGPIPTKEPSRSEIVRILTERREAEQALGRPLTSAEIYQIIER